MSSRSRSTTSAANARRASRIARLAIAAGAAAAVSPALPAPGDLDPTFGKGGRVIVDIENDNDSPAGMHLQPDGKIIVGRSNTASTDDFSVLRFNPNGRSRASRNRPPTGGAELATSEIQVGTTQPSTPPNNNTGGGGGAMSWEILMLMALVVLRRAWSSRSLRSAVPHQVSNIGDPDRTRDVFYCDRWLNVAQLPKHRLRELNAIAEIGQRHSTQFSLRTSRRQRAMRCRPSICHRINPGESEQ
jgi:hypothetical protein